MTGTQIINIDPENRFEVAQTDKVMPFIPAGFHSVIRYAELVSLSGLAPKGMEKADQIAGAIFYGLEIGMTPMAAVQSIAVINGRPSIWGDGALGLVRGSGLLDDIEEYYEGEPFVTPAEYDAAGKPIKPAVYNMNYKAVCKITRKGAKRPVSQDFSIGDAMAAGLWNKEGPWRNYFKRMLKMRARSWAMRDEFTDVLRGLVFAEEANDYDDMRDITPKKEEPPAPSVAAAEQTKPKRGRPAKNKFQEDDKEGVTEAEVITDQAAAPVETTEAKPAEAAVQENQEKIAAAPVTTITEKPKSVLQAEHREWVKALLDEVGPNKPLKDYIEGIDALLAMTETYETMKAAWNNRVKYGGTKAEGDFINRLRDKHKARVETADEDKAAADNPPAPSGAQAQKPSFDYPGFIHELDVELGAQASADEVTRVYSEKTGEPLRLGLITAQQDEDDLKPILAAHLDRFSDL